MGRVQGHPLTPKANSHSLRKLATAPAWFNQDTAKCHQHKPVMLKSLTIEVMVSPRHMVHHPRANHLMLNSHMVIPIVVVGMPSLQHSLVKPLLLVPMMPLLLPRLPLLELPKLPQRVNFP